MKNYIILNSRKRAIIALVHTVAFLAVAIITGMRMVHPLESGSPMGSWAIAGIYVVVSSVLLWLTAISGPLRERLYFACCSASAIFGLGRQLLGDSALHAAVYVRVLMLVCAVAMGTVILRGYAAAEELEELAGSSSSND